MEPQTPEERAQIIAEKKYNLRRYMMAIFATAILGFLIGGIENGLDIALQLIMAGGLFQIFLFFAGALLNRQDHGGD
ncbi:hypothetical protein V9K92_10315 [Phyllobacterium sp. CCNWLW109]|uniref:hypothetical protein n=1 Tax=Phyllobacterium sp. CCNWLW109 TaxID=3127479 RepID=UPI0030769F00